MEISLGQIVWSLAGRDKNRVYIVLQMHENGYVSIIDGDVRTIERPKKKKIKHLKVEPDVLEDIKIKLITKQRINNAEVRKLLSRYIATKENNGI